MLTRFMSLCLSKTRVPFYTTLLIQFVFSSLWLLPRIPDDTYGIPPALYYVGMIIVGFISIPIMLPKCLKDTAVEDDTQPKASVLTRLLSLYIPLCIYALLHFVAITICNLNSTYISSNILTIVQGIGLSFSVSFIWISICALLYYGAGRSITWYTIGYFVVNLSPVIISWGVNEIYNSFALMPYNDWNGLWYNPFTVFLGVFSRSYFFTYALPIVILVGLIVLDIINKTKPIAVNAKAISTVYKIVVIALISLSLGCLTLCFTKGLDLSVRSIPLIIVSILSVAFLLALVFRKPKFVKHIIISVVSVAIISALIAVVFPVVVEKKSFSLPNKADISSVRISMGHEDTFEVYDNIEGCLYFHRKLLNLFESGYSEGTELAYQEPQCAADEWYEFSITYNLKNGKRIHREYRYLYAGAFDDFFAELMLSDFYIDSIKNAKINSDSFDYSRTNHSPVFCDSSISKIEKLIDTYCAELEEAEEYDLYVKHDTLQIQVDHKMYYHRNIYVPHTFTKTRALVDKYFEEYNERFKN